MFENFDALGGRFVEGDEVFRDGEEGEEWIRLGIFHGSSGGGGIVGTLASEAQLDAVRAECRQLALDNEFAINGHENRISYVVGTGHAYRAVMRPGFEMDAELTGRAQAFLNEWTRVNRWHSRQQEIVRRKDRDGEAFLRIFPSDDGVARIRFVEPEQIRAPESHVGDPAASFGVLTRAEDVENVRAYAIDGRWVGAEEVQHRKANVDANRKRGLPLFYPVRKNLRRAEKLLRNMSVLAEIQSAIALIRKHGSGTRSSVQRFVDAQGEGPAAGSGASGNGGSGRLSSFRRYAPGTILDAMAGMEYEFPTIGLDASRYVAVLAAELRAIASRLVMPEFMLTSDASNANYASTMVAEGPAVRMFQRLQQEMIEDDLELFDRVIGLAVEAGRLPGETLERVMVQGFPPSLEVRDRLKEAKADEILLRAGVLSRETMGLRHGLEPGKERELMGGEGRER